MSFEDEVFSGVLRIEDVFFLIILPSDTYTCFSVDELLFQSVLTIHMIIAPISKSQRIIVFDSIKHMNKSVGSANSSHYESKYSCIICLERVKIPINCARCKNLMCFSHVKKILNKCPYCRLEPFQYTTDKYQEQLVKLDKKKEEEFLISTKVFKCLVEGCNFQGRYHKMDLHRRRQHRHENLNQILFEEERENARKKRALEGLMKRLQDNIIKNNKNYQVAAIMHIKCGKKVEIKKLFEMLEHVQYCGHKDCKKVYIEEEMCFIGNQKKQLSDCGKGAEYITFY